ncbi:MAG TPA: hypothetical protein VFV38_44125, partial [Ktedonobacteraceae bacterium]|nr:hypothetical protein [Ktedonobacteraceae bacterium]
VRQLGRKTDCGPVIAEVSIRERILKVVAAFAATGLLYSCRGVDPSVNGRLVLRPDKSDRPFSFISTRSIFSFPCPTQRQAASTWTRCGEKLVPRRANERYTTEPLGVARLGQPAYHSGPGRPTRRPRRASTRSLLMPTEPKRCSSASTGAPG